MATGLFNGTFPLLGYTICIENVLQPEVRDFWEKLGSCVATKEEGGHVDLFVPLGASGQCQDSRKAGDTPPCAGILCVSEVQSQTNRWHISFYLPLYLLHKIPLHSILSFVYPRSVFYK